ncbi:15686_t:CDS:1, partial [Funneliformis geosporum]
MSEVEETSITIDDNAAHNGEQITLLSASPNGEHVITYSSKDRSIEGWIVGENDSKCATLKRDPEVTVYKLSDDEKVNEMKVNDDKFVLYAWESNIRTFQMSKEKSIKPTLLNKSFHSLYFKNDGDLVLSVLSHDLSYYSYIRILIYSHIDGKLKFKKSRMVNSDKERKVMIENNKIWVITSNNLFKWDLDKFRFEFSYSLEFDGNDVENIIMRKNLILLKYNEKISIYLKEIHFPIRNIQIESNISVRILSNNYFLTFNLAKEDEKQDIILHHTTDINKQAVETKIFNDDNPENGFILFEYNPESRRAFGFVDGKISSVNLTEFNWHEWFVANHKDDEIVVGWNTYLNQISESPFNDTMVFPDMENALA